MVQNETKFGTQCHSAQGIEERHHEPTKNTLSKLRMDRPKPEKEFLLSSTIKACNDTLRPKGVVHSALILGEFPSLCSFLDPKELRDTLSERARAALTAWKLMTEVQEKVKV